MAKIPQFKTLDEAAGFWETHDFEDYVDDTVPVTIQVKIPRRKRVITVPLPLRIYERMEKSCVDLECYRSPYPEQSAIECSDHE